MLGAIVGDIVGSVYEWHNIKTKDFPLFRDDCFFTDDTVMTIASAEAIMNGGEKIILLIHTRSGEDNILIPVMEEGSETGYTLISVNLTTPGVTVQP